MEVGGKIYALKKIKLAGLKPKEFDNSINEIRILASIENPFIVCNIRIGSFISRFLSCYLKGLCTIEQLLTENSIQRRVYEFKGK